MIRNSFVILFAMFLVGCATMQAATPPVPQNTTQGLILAAYETAAIVNAATDSYEQELISLGALDTILVSAQQAQVAIDLGGAAVGTGDLSTAQAQLTLARNMLLAMKTLLGGN